MTADFSFQDWLNGALAVRGWPKLRLADELETSPAVISAWTLRGTLPEPATVARIATLFGVDPIAMFVTLGWLPGGRETPSTAVPRIPPDLLAALERVPMEDYPALLKVARGLAALPDP